MPHQIEKAEYPEEKVEVTVIFRGAYVSHVSWTVPPGISYEAWVENEDLIFEEDW